MTSVGRPPQVHRLAAGRLAALVAPGAGMLVASLRHRGEELLGQRADVETYARTGLWTGSSLLYPWANRLSERRFQLWGRTIDASGARTDERGAPLHGLSDSCRNWTVVAAGADRVSAILDWDDPAFPFPHRLRVEHVLTPSGLETTTEVTDDAPAAFGWHPFLVLPGEAREDWVVELGSASRVELDARKLPTGSISAFRLGPTALGGREFDEALADIEGPFVLEGKRRRLAVHFEEGAPYGQFFAPLDEALVSFEPMAAPGDALVSGWALPRAPYRMRFRIEVSDA